MVLTGAESDRLEIGFLVHGTEDASVRYRLTQFVAPLRRRGIELRIFEIPKETRPRIALFCALRSYPLVGIQRKLFSAPYLYLLRRSARRLVYDFDDALYIRDSKEASRPSWTRRGRFARTLRLADLVIAGNRSLLEAARAHGRRVRLLPTTIDTDRYRPRPVRGRDPDEVTLGWIGSRSTLFYLQDLAPVLEEVPSPGDLRLRLKIIADEFIDLHRMEVVRKVWSEEEEVEELREIDIGIMPLRDDAWSEGKCGLKLLQYMALGIPVICSPVGTNLDLVTDGVEGFHARDPEGWIRSIRKLATQPGLRRAMGARGRRKIEEGYSVAGTVPGLADALRSACR